ncbi:MAG: methylcrotonoyl-CoA carboxylase, partial [Salinibacterium sp.]|nr:methylcrotonoyl-CoA carboxylase [Salinibacterium sp.]
METLSSALDTGSESFRANDVAQRALVADLNERLSATALGGPEKSRERHVARGKLLPRDRVNRLLDDSSPFLEVAPLAAHDLYDNDSPGAGLVAGIGLVHGRHVMVVANDATVKGGTYYPMTV